jgi:hypothetical protein
MDNSKFNSFESFWPFYLKEHSNRTNRRFHFIGTSLSLLTILTSLILQFWLGLLLGIVFGYAFAWVGHFIIEKNRPATFTYPIWSLRGDFKMFWMILTRKMKF